MSKVPEWVYEGIDESLLSLRDGLDFLDQAVEQYPESDTGYADLIRDATVTAKKVNTKVLQEIDATKAPRRRGAERGAASKREKLKMLVETPLESLIESDMTKSVLAKAALFQSAIALKQDLLLDNHWRNGSSARIRQLAKNNLLRFKHNLDIEKFSQAAVEAAMKYARNVGVS